MESSLLATAGEFISGYWLHLNGMSIYRKKLTYIANSRNNLQAAKRADKGK